MNRKELRKDIGKTFRFHPLPKRESATGGSWVSDVNLWINQGETSDKKGWKFRNAISNHDPLILDPNFIRNFDEPDILVLRGQVILKDASVSFEPFHPKPASAISTKLSLFINHNPEDSATICPPLTGRIEFMVVNQGEHTVRDFRNIIYVPEAFQENDDPLDPVRDFKRDIDIALNGEGYTVYANLISEPIFQEDTVHIGTLDLRAQPGEYIFRWRIRCDDGVFPAEKDLGSIKVKVVPLSEVIGQALDHFGEPSDES